MTIKNLGFIGIGNMGSRMVPHIASTGVSIHIYDINKEASSNLARTHNNIVAVNNAAAVAEAADAVITMLPAGPDVKECALGKAGLLEGFSKGDIILRCPLAAMLRMNTSNSVQIPTPPKKVKKILS